MPREYKLGGTALSGARLHMLHHLTRTNFDGDLLSERIREAVGDRPRVADLACGTGVWSLELAEELPDATVEGFDITLEEVPADDMLPANVSFKQLDLLSEIPKELTSKYDVVNVRYVVCFVHDEDFELVLNNLLSMTKPGGWLQWTDVNASSWKLICKNAHAAAPALRSSLDSMRNAHFNTDDVRWTRSISDRFEDRSLEAVHLKQGPSKLSNSRACLMNWLWGLDEMFQCESANFSEEAKIERTAQYELALKEAKILKAGFDFGMFRCVGKKALE